MVSSVFPLSLITVIEKVASLLGSTLICVVPADNEFPYIFLTLELPAAVSLLLDAPAD